MNRNSKLNGNEILHKINQQKYLKTPIKIHLKINEFPLTNYCLEKQNFNYENNIDKTYILKYVSVTDNMINNNLNSKYCLQKPNNNSLNNLQNIVNNTFNNNNNSNFNSQMNNMNNNMCSNNNMMIPMNNLMNNNNMNNFMNSNNNMNLMNSNNNMNNIFLSNYPNTSPNKINNSLNNNKINEDNNNKLKSLLFPQGYEDFFPLTGLSNIDMTSCMNSTLQCLLHIPELTYYFINKYPFDEQKLNKINKDVETHGKLSKEYYNVVENVCKSQFNPKSKKYFYNDSFSPKEFNIFLSRINPQFFESESNNSKDLLLFLIRAMHAELNYFGDEKLDNIPKCNQLIEQESYDFFIKKNFTLNLSIISYLFYGIIKSITICHKCKSNLYNFQYFQFLSFPTYHFDNKRFNLYQGLKEYTKPE